MSHPPAMSPARERRAQKEGELINEKRNFITLLFARSARDRPHHPRAHSARSEPPRASLRPRECFRGRFDSPMLVSAHAQAFRTNLAHVEVAAGPLGGVYGLYIGGTQLPWETTYPPRHSARRQTTTTSRLTPEPRARRPRRRRRWSSGRRLARPPRPPIRETACRGTQCPGLQSGCQGACGASTTNNHLQTMAHLKRCEAAQPPPRVLVGSPMSLGFGLGERLLLLERRGRARV